MTKQTSLIFSRFFDFFWRSPGEWGSTGGASLAGIAVFSLRAGTFVNISDSLTQWDFHMGQPKTK